MDENDKQTNDPAAEPQQNDEPLRDPAAELPQNQEASDPTAEPSQDANEKDAPESVLDAQQAAEPVIDVTAFYGGALPPEDVGPPEDAPAAGEEIRPSRREEVRPQPPAKVDAQSLINGVKIGIDPAIGNLFPQRTDKELGVLQRMVQEVGFDNPVLIADWGMSEDRRADGSPIPLKLAVDGLDELTVYANLLALKGDSAVPRNEQGEMVARNGKVIRITFTRVYLTNPGDPEITRREVMAAAIRQRASRKAVAKGDIAAAIEKYILFETSIGINRTGTWLAVDLGCSASWANEIRVRLVNSGQMASPKSLEKRNGKFQDNPSYKAPKLEPAEDIKTQDVLPDEGDDEDQPETAQDQVDEGDEGDDDESDEGDEGDVEDNPDGQPAEGGAQPEGEEDMEDAALEESHGVSDPLSRLLTEACVVSGVKDLTPTAEGLIAWAEAHEQTEKLGTLLSSWLHTTVSPASATPKEGTEEVLSRLVARARELEAVVVPENLPLLEEAQTVFSRLLKVARAAGKRVPRK